MENAMLKEDFIFLNWSEARAFVKKTFHLKHEAPPPQLNYPNLYSAIEIELFFLNKLSNDRQAYMTSIISGMLLSA